MQIFNKRGYSITICTYNVNDNLTWMPFLVKQLDRMQSTYIQAQDHGRGKLRVGTETLEIMAPGHIFHEEDNLSFEQPPPSPHNHHPKEDEVLRPGEPPPELAKFLRDNDEKVYFVDGCGNYLP